MDEKLDKIIRLIYKGWKADYSKAIDEHPDEEAMVCFLEGRLPEAESEGIKSHIVKCSRCADIVVAHFRLQSQQSEAVPDGKIVEKIKHPIDNPVDNILEVVLRLKNKCLEIVNATGDVLMDQELIPVSVLRSRQIKKFKDELVILKSFGEARLELKVENKDGEYFNLIITVKHKQTQALLKDVRITLLRQDTELESYLVDSGTATFEHVSLGKYTIDVFSSESRIASVTVEIEA